MNQAILAKYAALLVQYSLDVQPGEKVFIRTTTLAEPLVEAVYAAALEAGAALVEVDFSIRNRQQVLLDKGTETAVQVVSPLYDLALRTFDCFLTIRAPFEAETDAPTDGRKSALLRTAYQPIHKVYTERTATRALKRTLCEYPTVAGAKKAGLSLEAYADFIFKACKLDTPDPKAAWLEVRALQQFVVDYLNRTQMVRYVGRQTDITFNTAGRTWINSDGQTNMPSGEVYTSPVEDSVNGVVHFDIPMVHDGHALQGVTLWVENGYIQRWEAQIGQSVLDAVFQMPGARRFGEAAIGTNYNIQVPINNILFDEKMGGTIHMAIGQSYLQAGGQNESAVHWDMIHDMRQQGQIFADGVLIYEKGQFLISPLTHV